MKPEKTGDAILRFMRDLASRPEEIVRAAKDLRNATDDTISDVMDGTSATVLAAYSAMVMLTDASLEGALIASRLMVEARRRECLDRKTADGVLS
jgi:uncharacterized protein with von Willebrand factor type A (vWA) domain